MVRRGAILLGLACVGLAACAMPPGAPPSASLAGARQACNAQYPRRIGLYLPHAQCVNRGVERFALPGARYPDLIRLQEEVRVSLCRRIDSRRLSPETGDSRMAEADRLIAEAERRRNAADNAGAAQRLAAVDAILR